MPVRNITNTSYETKLDRHTTEEIANLTPEDGALVFDTTTNTQKIYNGTDWIDLQNPDTFEVKTELEVSGDIICLGASELQDIYVNDYSEFYSDVYFDNNLEVNDTLTVNNNIESSYLLLAPTQLGYIPSS